MEHLRYLERLRHQFADHLDVVVRRPDIFQLVVPLYHEDGDMVDIFIDQKSSASGKVRICDLGKTLMHLSYYIDIEGSESKMRILNKILQENGIEENDGNFYLDAPITELYPYVLQFGQAAAKVSSLRVLKRETVQSMFIEQFRTFVTEELRDFEPEQNVTPIPERDDLEVDIRLNAGGRPLYLYGVRDTAKARLVALSCLEFQRANIPFESIAVHEDMTELPKKDQTRLTNVVDKQYTTLNDFSRDATQFLRRRTQTAA